MKQWLIWFIQVFTWHKSFKKNPIIGNLFLNKLGLHVVRYTISHLFFNIRQVFLFFLMTSSQRKAFKKDGYLIVKDFLPKSDFEKLKNEAQNYDGEYLEIKEGPTITRRVFLDKNLIQNYPHLNRFCNHKSLLKLIRYASSKNRWPSFHIENIIHGKDTDKSHDPQKILHSDCFHPTIKAWLFIENVNELNGPFNYVKSSNQFSFKRLRWEYQQSILASRKEEKTNKKRNWDGSFRANQNDLIMMGYESPIPLIVAENSLVIANTHGFHRRGNAHHRSSRMSIWMQCRDNPFNLFIIPSPKLGAKFFNMYRTKRLFSKYRNKLNNGALQIKIGRLID
jgi:hypothetical protein